MTKRQSGEIVDVVGPWTEIKLEIIGEYARIFSIIASSKFKIIPYIDGFVNIGQVLSKSGEMIKGSALRVLDFNAFTEFHLIDIDDEKVNILKRNISEMYPDKISKVITYEGDANKKIIQEVLPNIVHKCNKYELCGLCLLDPYGAHIKWDVIKQIAKHRFDLIVNFSIFDIQRNAGHVNKFSLDPAQVSRIDDFFGGHDWYSLTRISKPSLFDAEADEKNPRFEIELVNLYKEKLQKEFGYASNGIRFQNSTNASLFYIIFASHHPKGLDIANWFVKKYSKNNG
ncbi:MAG: three-Cys-motif partner protein TcmP [Caldisericia bacterium]|nr:three-Cys-motif partner protein TcmP [Caldisericia bacterium]